MRHSLDARRGCLLAAVAIGLFAPGCERAPQADSIPENPDRARADGDPDLPGVARIDIDLQRRLEQAFESQQGDYVPRTHHLEKDGSPRFTNRLILESSPYLLQHAHNPVNWYPWSEEAFERAKRENKPVFLSIGYSTCHWCHVMERESFEDEEIAAFLNRHFISIKVDREERPDVDSVYMTAVQILTGRGGWPMTVIMTPDKDPFFGGTYFPPRKGVRGSRAGLVDILTEMVRLYEQEPTRAIEQAQELSQQIARVTTTLRGAGVPSDRVIVQAAQRLAAAFDPVDGGFGRAPKFPQPARLTILLRYARRTEDPGALHILTMTLDKMAAGGVYDHVGGGFHRYSTDGQWLVPHFEKMLYDNAQLASVYIDTWQLAGNPNYRRVARDILDYVAAEMTSPEGGFYSATDADSPTPSGHDEEGWFFTWTLDELERLLGKERAAIVGAAYGVMPTGNFEGRNILHRNQTNREVASRYKTTPKRVAEILAEARPVLYEARASRPPPIRDEKVIAAWNGLMISAFARAAWALDEPRYAALATRSARFVWDKMRNEDGALLRTYKGGQRSSTAFLDDYAFMIAAYLDLYEATADAAWLERALQLQAIQDARYADLQEGGYFMTPNDGELLLVREKPTHDGAVPSGNSVAALNLLRLYDFTDEGKWRERAEALFTALASRIARAPSGYPQLLVALDYYYDVPLEIAVIAETNLADTSALAERLREAFVPNKVSCVLTEAAASAHQRVVPWLEGKRTLRGKPTAYVCERGRCDLPTSNPSVFARQIDKRRPYPSYAETAPPRLPVNLRRSN